MKNSDNKLDAAPLRQKAEKLLVKKRKNSSLLLSEYEKQKLIHELSVHQIELELQNDELALAEGNMRKLVDELTLSNSRNLAILQAVPDLMFRINCEGVFLDFQAQTTSDLYVPPDRIIGRKMHEILPPYLVELISRHLQTLLEAGELQVFEYALPMPAGLNYFEARMVLSKANEVVTIVRNITERKLADEKLIQSEERYKRITEGLTDYLYTVNVKDGKVVETLHNEACLPITGYTQKELSDDPYLWIDMVVPEERAFVVERALTILKGIEQPPCELHIRNKDGELRWIKNTTILHYGLNGELVSYDGVLKDITERKQIESALIDSEEKFSVAFRTSPNAILITQPKEGLIIDANEAFFSLTGYTREETINNTTTKMNLWADEEIRDSVIAELIAGRSVKGEELRFKIKNGKIITGLYSAQLIRIKNNTHILSCIADITERVYAEQELIIANKELAFQNEEKEKQAEELIKAKEHAEESDRLKSAFLANLSHEIRTPMNGILGFAELLKEPDLSGEQQQEFLSVIAKSCNRLLNIINDIVDISIIESGQMNSCVSQTNINEQIEHIHSVYLQEAEQAGLHIYVKNALQTNEAIIHTDKNKLNVILSNLVKNALKFTNKGYIEIGYDSTGSSTDRSTTELTFFVKDTGIGIPKDRQEAIFERFMQADITDTRCFQGAGLGLAISKAYVELLGGKIWVESEEENQTKTGGSTFYFTLPYPIVPIEKEVINHTGMGEEEKNKMDKLKILIAEDDEGSEKFLTFTVRRFSKKILNARTGVETVETCRNNPDIDLVIMDIKMPDMDGYEATRQIRLFNQDVVIIAQTAYALSGDREMALEAGCNDYISKPVGKSHLIALIKTFFDKS